MELNKFHLVPASSRQQYPFDIRLLLYVQSRTPDDGRRDRPKQVECYLKINNLGNKFHFVPASSRQQYLFDICLLLYVQSRTPDDGRRDRLKHIECYAKINILSNWCI
jgi:hypothetical protein